MLPVVPIYWKGSSQQDFNHLPLATQFISSRARIQGQAGLSSQPRDVEGGFGETTQDDPFSVLVVLLGRDMPSPCLP